MPFLIVPNELLIYATIYNRITIIIKGRLVNMAKLMKPLRAKML